MVASLKIKRKLNQKIIKRKSADAEKSYKPLKSDREKKRI